MSGKQTLLADPQTVNEIFRSPNQYSSPLFQREYVWKTKKIEDIFDSIDKIINTEESSSFFGAVVLEPADSEDTHKNTFWIVDGQQRLTTVFIILLAIAEMYEKNGYEDESVNILENYLLFSTRANKGQTKINPTLPDFSQFSNILKKVNTIFVKPRVGIGPDKGTITAAYNKATLQLKNRVKNNGTFDVSMLSNIEYVILNAFNFVVIHLGAEDDPHQVFDRLNFEGESLHTVDLVRNIVFKKLVNDPEEAFSVHRERWTPLQKKLDKKFNNYFFPYCLVHDSSTTKSNLLTKLRDKWADVGPTEIITELEDHVNVYLLLQNRDEFVEDSFKNNVQIAKRLRRLQRMSATSSCYPYLFKLIFEYESGTVSEDDACECLDTVESFLVRRAFSGIEPTGLHAVFKTLWNKCGASSEKIIDEIDSLPTVTFPGDEVFKEAILSSNLYKKKICNYILDEYERGLVKGDPHPGIEISVDRIIPEKHKKHWKLGDDFEDELIFTWANLVPLSNKANTEKNNRSWQYAKELYETETVFKTTKKIAVENNEWGLQELTKRADTLAEWAISRWNK